MSKPSPSIDTWLAEAKTHEDAAKIGMYLTHNGVVRETAKAKVRQDETNTRPVCGMLFSYDAQKIDVVIADTYAMDGIYYIKVWLNEGQLTVGLIVTGASEDLHLHTHLWLEVQSRNHAFEQCTGDDGGAVRKDRVYVPSG